MSSSRRRVARHATAEANVFISWSGVRSKVVAAALHEWLPKVIQVVRPWMSAEDIAAGARWSAEIAAKLEQCRVGIVCVTSDNQSAPWLNFEAGAISKAVGELTRVCPFYFDLKPAETTGPLTQFQGTRATREGTLALVRSINGALGSSVEMGALDEIFGAFWPKFEEALAAVPRIKASHPKPSQVALLEEILETVRGVERTLVHESNYGRQAELFAQAAFPDESDDASGIKTKAQIVDLMDALKNSLVKEKIDARRTRPVK